MTLPLQKIWFETFPKTAYRENGEVLAVVEAKKTAVDGRLAEAQLIPFAADVYPEVDVVFPIHWRASQSCM